MALHQRHQIRHAAKAALLNQTIAEDRVEATRKVPWRPSELPALAIYTLEETVAPASVETAPRELERRLQLALEGAVRVDAAVDDALDAFAVEIERAIHADDTLGGTASDAVLEGTEVLGPFADGDQLVAVIRLTYGVTYYTYAPEAGDDDLDDFKTADVHYDLKGEQEPANQAEDLVEDLDA